MRQRMFTGLCILGGLNLLLFAGCYASLTSNPSSGPEGLGTALVAYFSLFLSALFAALGVNQAFAESRHGMITWRTALATLLAAAPLLFYIFVEVSRTTAHK